MLRIALVALAMAGAFVLVTPGCSDACEDLAPVCERCTDANTRASCEQTVDADVQDTCSAREGLYERDCPEVFTVASSSGAGVTNTVAASTASSSASAGGAGGTSAAGGAGGQGGN